VELSAVFQPEQWAEKETGKTIENRTQPELVPNQASKSNIVRGAHNSTTRLYRLVQVCAQRPELDEMIANCQQNRHYQANLANSSSHHRRKSDLDFVEYRKVFCPLYNNPAILFLI